MIEFDLLNIQEDLFPITVFSDNATGFFPYLIRVRTKGMYQHIMTAIRNRTFASQGVVTFSKVPFSSFMRKGFRLKFVGARLSKGGKVAVLDSIYEKLGKSKDKRVYDFLGILGQLLGLKWINNPFTHICPEDVVHHLKKAIPYETEEVAEVLRGLPDHGSPEDVNEYQKKHQNVFYVIGRWQYD